MSIRIKGPNADDIFESWKQKASRKVLEKQFGVKKAQFTLDMVTAAESVKNVNKEALIFFRAKMAIKKSEGVEVQKTTFDKLEKIKFYQFSKNVEKSEWKDDDKVPFYSTLKEVNCPTCRGSGKVTCKKCGGEGTVTCPECNGSGNKGCNKCNGRGKQILEITVIDGNGKKMKKDRSVQCPECFGTAKLTCSKCGGVKRVICRTCDGKGSEPCDECKGTGKIYQFEIRPVPFKERVGVIPFIIPSVKKLDKDLENKIGQDIEKLFDKVRGIPLKSAKDLQKKLIEPSLGYYSKSIDKMVDNTTKTIKKYSKMDDHSIEYPIYLYPFFELECETRKGKKFKVYSIGADNGFIVFGDL